MFAHVSQILSLRAQGPMSVPLTRIWQVTIGAAFGLGMLVATTALFLVARQL